jgi:hypothetical protein
VLSNLSSHVRQNVVAYIAVFIALSGTAYASKPMITGADVQDESLTGADVQNDSLKGADVDEASLSGISPNGSAGGDLTGSYPNPSIAGGAVGTAKFSSGIPAVRVIAPVRQTIPNDNSTFLTFDAEDYDTADLHSTSTSPERLTAPVTGVYRFSFGVLWLPDSTGVRQLVLERNGVIQQVVATPASSGFLTQNGSSDLKLAAGDHVDVLAYQSSGGDLEAGRQFLTMSWVAPG